MAVEIKTTRGHRIEDNKCIAFTVEEFVNGDGNNVKRIVEEEITLEYANKVLSTNVRERKAELDEALAQTKKDIKITYKRIGAEISTREYIQFKEYIRSVEYKRMKTLLQMEENKLPMEDILSLEGMENKFKAFKEKINTKDFKNKFITMMDEDQYLKLKNQEEKLNKSLAEVKPWEKQFRDIKEELGAVHGEEN